MGKGAEEGLLAAQELAAQLKRLAADHNLLFNVVAGMLQQRAGPPPSGGEAALAGAGEAFGTRLVYALALEGAQSAAEAGMPGRALEVAAGAAPQPVVQPADVEALQRRLQGACHTMRMGLHGIQQLRQRRAASP